MMQTEGNWDEDERGDQEPPPVQPVMTQPGSHYVVGDEFLTPFDHEMLSRGLLLSERDVPNIVDIDPLYAEAIVNAMIEKGYLLKDLYGDQKWRVILGEVVEGIPYAETSIQALVGPATLTTTSGEEIEIDPSNCLVLFRDGMTYSFIDMHYENGGVVVGLPQVQAPSIRQLPLDIDFRFGS